MKKRFLFLFVILGLVFVNSCQKEHSLESGNGPSEGTLQDDGSGDCLPKTVNGAYVVGVALVGTVNYIEVTVDVTTVGNFTIHTDTVNGMYFRATGVFTATGITTVRLKGFGTPAGVGITNFVVTYGTSQCTIAVTTAGSLAVFTLDGAPGGCMGAVPAGTYTAGTILNSSNTVTITVTVTTAGAYNLSTVVSNGMTFSGFGTLAVGTQTITLVGAGTPVTPGTTNVQVSAGATSCSFTLNVGGTAATATYTVKCNTAVPNGTYTQNVALVAANTVTITVDVATAGTYSITGTAGGMTFSSTGSFAAAGAGQTVTLNGTGTPNTSGAVSIPLTGGTAGCSFNITVNPPAAGSAIFVVNCAGATPVGTYTQNVALTAANTITLPVNVTTIGTYPAITTTLANGMTFTAPAGSFAAMGVQNITLTGSGTPTVSGATSIPVTAGTTPCNINLNVNPGTGGAAVFTVDCNSASLNGYLTKGVAIAAVNTITIDVNVTSPGTYNITTTPINGITYTASGTFAAAVPTTVTLNGSGIPTNSGTFTLNIPNGNPACGFSIDVDPNYGTWSFKVGTTTYSGTIYDAYFDPTLVPAPATAFILLGDDAAGNLFEIDLVDVNGTIVSAEIYKCAPPITGNAAGLYYDGANGTTYYADPADATLATNTVSITVGTHNAAARTMSGTFSGNALLNGTTTLANITQGTFSVTYP